MIMQTIVRPNVIYFKSALNDTQTLSFKIQ